MDKDHWTDRSESLIFACCSVIIVLFFIAAFAKAVQIRKFIDAIIIFSLLPMTMQISRHYLPVKVVKNKIILAQEGLLKLGRRVITISDLRKIEITPCKKWDEGGNVNGIYGVIRASDKYGNKYRNMIYHDQIKYFKEVLLARLPQADILVDRMH